MKVIVTGASGMVGKGVLLECLDHDNITEVLSIGRRSLEMSHPKLKELIHKDFSSFEEIKEQLVGYDACYHCMGVSAVGMSEENYMHRTHTFSMALAKAFIASSPNSTFIYVSGVGTDSSEKGRTMWARVKGKTENDLFKMNFSKSFAFRPGAIIPLRGIKSSTAMYQFLINNFMWLIKGIKRIAPNSVVNTTQIGLAMINATQKGYDKKVVLPKDILVLSND